MKAFSELIDRLVLTPARNGKLALLTDYFAQTPDPDRGYALAALTEGLDIPAVKPALLRALALERIDEVLFAYSYDYVGDLAETISLIWPDTGRTEEDGSLSLSAFVETLSATSKLDAPKVFASLLDQLDPSERYAAIKLVTGGLRIGVSARLTRQALANLGGKDIIELEELWHGLEMPYRDLFAWLENKADKPQNNALALFRPVMLANAVQTGDLDGLDPDDYRLEWKWDGIRVQVSSEGGVRKLYSRSGDDISGAFLDLLDAVDFEAVIDGELLVGRPGEYVGTFNELQQRLNRKTVSQKLQKQYPAFVRCYDLLMLDGTDTRSLPLTERRKRLETLIQTLDTERFDLSPQLDFDDWAQVDDMRKQPEHPVIEGVMLKHKDSPYIPGRKKGPWFKWKRDPHTIDAVLMYAQRGHGKRSSYYSDYTFGVWQDSEGRRELVPVGKAYFGFSDAELKLIDKYVRENTVDRFGPVRAVTATTEKGLVFEVAFEGIARSKRHKSGVAMRFPRISRLRWDKPANEADTLETLESMIETAPVD
ncbi:cisplatin damage response ATP-dependent DNA ligase [Rhizobium sp. L1K21]|uniref:cisplatin damage response ATP-dependent DNA ligase n=1 Tax=Rhizobium sp. L1K21 TaxID=2954933 RepID=UPI0020937166|nr:cisplatin damage response ATP-dependent DNA ligase [Rhizobium sp. L1K21]MCO6187734.1 cisplatin damage response ATP-dependent DNA ligase [Rhizobium sp. L1K21]